MIRDPDPVLDPERQLRSAHAAVKHELLLLAWKGRYRLVKSLGIPAHRFSAASSSADLIETTLRRLYEAAGALWHQC